MVGVPELMERLSAHARCDFRPFPPPSVGNTPVAAHEQGQKPPVTTQSLGVLQEVQVRVLSDRGAQWMPRGIYATTASMHVMDATE